MREKKRSGALGSIPITHHGSRITIHGSRTMSALDSILNVVGLLLWINWAFFAAVSQGLAAASSASARARATLRSRLRGWHFLVFLAGLLFLRAVLYWQLGPAVEWLPNLNLGPLSISFRSDIFERVLLFSILSFGSVLGTAYSFLLLLSVINRQDGETDPWQRFLRQHLKWVEGWPWPVKLLLPWFAAALLWLAVFPVLTACGLVPRPVSGVHRLEQALVLGLCAFLTWKFPLVLSLGLYLLGSYVFLGRQSFWNFVNLTGRNLLSPLRPLPLRVARLDFAPLIGIAIVLAAAGFAERGLGMLYRRLPL